MKTYEVRLNKPTLVDDWCIWDERDIKVRQDYTVAVIVAFSEDRLKQKLEKLYPGVQILGFKEIK